MLLYFEMRSCSKIMSYPGVGYYLKKYSYHKRRSDRLNVVLYDMRMTIDIPVLGEGILTSRFLQSLTLQYVGFQSLVIMIYRHIFIIIVKHHKTLTIKLIRAWITKISVVVSGLLVLL